MKKLLVDFRINYEDLNTLKKLGYDVILCPPCKNLYEPVCGHPDMLVHIIDENNIIVHKDIDKDFLNKLTKLNIHFSQSSLVEKYPYDIFLNAVNLENVFIHNIRYTDVNLLNLVKHKKLVNVKQGYTKCSTAIVNDHAIMTSDISIAKAVENENIDVLLLPPGDILLPGLNYGFIGGACGLIEKNLLAFYGDLKYYAFEKEVVSFLKKHKVEPVFLRKGKLIDRGSILTITNRTLYS